ncbi:hypothetical protein [Streptomyces radiopugnans]|uniref:hypothetical protein n=1 Tax=Streptomyces radiopugnans TaxID=403935 RepID=UPI003F1CFA82
MVEYTAVTPKRAVPTSCAQVDELLYNGGKFGGEQAGKRARTSGHEGEDRVAFVTEMAGSADFRRSAQKSIGRALTCSFG